jgi:phosphinothricin acetyltransferase
MQFHSHFGYRLVGRFNKCGYKFGKWYDMIWMEKLISEHPEKPEEIIPFRELDT